MQSARGVATSGGSGFVWTGAIAGSWPSPLPSANRSFSGWSWPVALSTGSARKASTIVTSSTPGARLRTRRCYTGSCHPRAGYARPAVPTEQPASPSRLPPLLRDRSTAQIVVLAGVVPFVFGVITGFALDWSAAVYFVLLALAAIGGVGAGLDHDTTAHGARRGLLGGALFTAGILITNAVIGAAHADELPHPNVLLFLINCGFGVLFGALGARLRLRAQRRGEVSSG